MTELKSLIEGFDSRLDQAEQSVSLKKKKKRFYFLNLASAQKWKNELQSRASFNGSDVSIESLS